MEHLLFYILVVTTSVIVFRLVYHLLEYGVVLLSLLKSLWDIKKNDKK